MIARGRPRALSPAEAARLVDAYLAGDVPVEELARRHGIACITAHRYIARAGASYSRQARPANRAIIAPLCPTHGVEKGRG